MGSVIYFVSVPPTSRAALPTPCNPEPILLKAFPILVNLLCSTYKSRSPFSALFRACPDDSTHRPVYCILCGASDLLLYSPDQWPPADRSYFSDRRHSSFGYYKTCLIHRYSFCMC